MNRDEELIELQFREEYLKKLLVVVQSRIFRINDDIKKEIQEKCDHNFQYDGHGHNYSVYKCDKCRHSEEL